MDTGRRHSSLAEFVYENVPAQVSREDFMEEIKEWSLIPIEPDGEIAAVVMVKANEVHVAVREGYESKWMGRGTVIRGILAPILEEHGELVTSCGYLNNAGRAFVERLGFTPASVTYRLEKLKHA